MKHNGRSGLPKGAGFGHEPNRRAPKLLDFGEIAEYGSRAQRRFAAKRIRQLAKRGGR